MSDPPGRPKDGSLRLGAMARSATVLFLGPAGEEPGERLLGAGLPDFYGALPEPRIEAARAALRRG